MVYRHGRKYGTAKNQDNTFPLRAAILPSKNADRYIDKYIAGYTDAHTVGYVTGYTGGYMSDFIIFFGISGAELLYIPY